MSQTLHDRFCMALEYRGHRRVVNARTGKYTVYARADLDQRGRPTFYYVGVSGALRVGANATESIPASSKFKDLLLAYTEKRGPSGPEATATLQALGLL